MTLVHNAESAASLNLPPLDIIFGKTAAMQAVRNKLETGCGDRRPRPDPGRKRHRKRDMRASAARLFPARPGLSGEGQLSGNSPFPARNGAVWL